MKLLLLLASTALATWHKPLPGQFSLLARDSNGNCTAKNTCSDCYGAGNILCDNAGCFNPNKGEQCCRDGYTCVAKDNSCCDTLGTGTPGTDGLLPLPTGSASASSTSGIFDTIICTPEQTNEECCSQSGLYPSLKWCYGSYPDQMCYNPKHQICCSEGTVCFGEGCCDLVSASAITPDPVRATALPDGTGSVSASTWGLGTSQTMAGMSATATATATGNPATSSPTPSQRTNAALATGINGLLMGVGVVMAGLGL